MSTPKYFALLKSENQSKVLTDNFIVSIGDRSYSIIHDSVRDNGSIKPVSSLGGFASKILPVYDFTYKTGEYYTTGDVISTDGKNRTTLLALGFNHFNFNHSINSSLANLEKIGNVFIDSDFDECLFKGIPKIESNVQFEGGASVFPKFIWNKDTQTKLPVRGLAVTNGELRVFTNDDFKSDFNRKSNIEEISTDTIAFDSKTSLFVWETPFSDSLGQKLYTGDMISVFENNSVVFGEITFSPIFGFEAGPFNLKPLLDNKTKQVIRAGSVFESTPFEVKN